MKKLAAAVLMTWSATLAHAAPPTAESVEELLAVTQAQGSFEHASRNLESYIRQGMQAARGDKPLTARQQQMLEALPRKMVAAMQPEFSWEALKPDVLSLYAETFSQEEVDGMIAFYKSPAGQSITTKMPGVMNRIMQMTQARMAAAMPRMQAALAAAVAEVKAQGEDPARPQP